MEIILISVLYFVSLATRLYKINIPNLVCWDEYHFTRMINSYLNNVFFLDVHPPLGKLLLTSVAHHHGYTGNFSFIHVGIPYADYFPYVRLRMSVGIVSSLVPVLCYLIVFKLLSNRKSAFLTYLLVICDTSFLTMGRFILLDSFLYVFVLITFYCSLQYLSRRVLSIGWLLCLLLTGVFLAFAVSVKFIGLFVVPLIALLTLSNIWNQFESDRSLNRVIKQLCCYFYGLFCVPSIVYILIYVLHFSLLYKSGPSDAFFSIELQASLEGNQHKHSHDPTVTEVAYNHNISLKMAQNSGLFLYSDPTRYEIGDDDEFKPVSTSSLRNKNNKWQIQNWEGYVQNKRNLKKNQNKNDEYLLPQSNAMDCVKNGDTIFLQHAYTKEILCVTNYSSYTKPENYLVASSDPYSYGTLPSENLGMFLFEIRMPKIDDSLCLTTHRDQFYLLNNAFGCYVSVDTKASLEENLPLEVSCTYDLEFRKLWTFDQVFLTNDAKNKSDEHVSFNNGITFWEKFVEYHLIMIQANNNLKVKKDELFQEPWQWPFNYQAHPVSGPNYLVFIIGNPLVWLVCLICICLYLIHLIGCGYCAVKCRVQIATSNSCKDTTGKYQKQIKTIETSKDASRDNKFELHYTNQKINKNKKQLLNSVVISDGDLSKSLDSTANSIKIIKSSFKLAENHVNNSNNQEDCINNKIHYHDKSNKLKKSSQKKQNSSIESRVGSNFASKFGEIFKNEDDSNCLSVCNLLLFGWFLHYAPFWFMCRVLFLHHYLTAQLFAIMFTGCILTYAIAWFASKCVTTYSTIGEWLTYLIFVLLYIFSFLYFCPLSYGIDATADEGFEYAQKLLEHSTIKNSGS